MKIIQLDGYDRLNCQLCVGPEASCLQTSNRSGGLDLFPEVCPIGLCHEITNAPANCFLYGVSRFYFEHLELKLGLLEFLLCEENAGHNG